MNGPLGNLGDSVDCLKLLSGLCTYVYLSIFLGKEVPGFYQMFKRSQT